MDDVQAQEIVVTPAHLELAIVGAEARDDDVAAHVREACELGLRAVVVRPSDVDQAVRICHDPVVLAAVCGYPDGSSTTSAKVYEARDALRRGAREIHAVPNVGKLNSRQFQYVEVELIQLAQACHESGARLRVIFQTPLLAEEGRLVASKIAKRSEVDSVMAAVAEAPAEHVELLLRKCLPLAGVCAYESALDGVLRALGQGCFCVSVPHPSRILQEWALRQKAGQPSENPVLR